MQQGNREWVTLIEAVLALGKVLHFTSMLARPTMVDGMVGLSSIVELRSASQITAGHRIMLV